VRDAINNSVLIIGYNVRASENLTAACMGAAEDFEEARNRIPSPPLQLAQDALEPPANTEISIFAGK
jgi:hypothetical protein